MPVGGAWPPKLMQALLHEVGVAAACLTGGWEGWGSGSQGRNGVWHTVAVPHRLSSWMDNGADG